MERLKWCIKRDPSNEKEIDEILSKEYDTYDAPAWVRYIYKSDDEKLYLSQTPVYSYHEISLSEFRLLYGVEFKLGYIRVREQDAKEISELFGVQKEAIITKMKAVPYAVFDSDLNFKLLSMNSKCPTISIEVFRELVRMKKENQQSHYSANPEVTTTLDPVTEYQTKSPKGELSFDFAKLESVDVSEAAQKYAEKLKEKHRKNAMLSELNSLIKAQKKIIKQFKALRDKLNAETNY